LKEIGEVKSLESFANSLLINPKSMVKHMKNLINKGYVEKTTVYKGIYD
jgi:predicted ArsR family transcriptional regulator